MQHTIIKSIALPLFFLGVSLSLYGVWKILDLPPKEELTEIARAYFATYGLITVLVSAVLEGLLIVGWYYPGSLVIFLGVLFVGKDVPRTTGVVAVVTIGLFVAYVLDFLIGRYGWYRLLLAFGIKGPLESAQRRLTKHGPSSIFLSYWQPNLAALTATAAGILHVPFRTFLVHSFVAVVIWNIFWGTLVYVLGEAALSLVGLQFVFIVIGIWIAFRVFSGMRRRGSA